MNWEMHHHCVVEARPRPGMINTLNSKTVVYLEREIGWMQMLDDYDGRSQLWENYLYRSAYLDRPVSDAKIAISPFKRAFAVGAAFTDTQSVQTSPCYLPSPNAREKECWYISMGAVTNADITPESLVKRAPSLPARWASGVVDGLTVDAPVFRPFIPVPFFALAE
jgi:Protein of unknown function (DUF1329)